MFYPKWSTLKNDYDGILLGYECTDKCFKFKKQISVQNSSKQVRVFVNGFPAECEGLIQNCLGKLTVESVDDLKSVLICVENMAVCPAIVSPKGKEEVFMTMVRRSHEANSRTSTTAVYVKLEHKSSLFFSTTESKCRVEKLIGSDGFAVRSHECKMFIEKTGPKSSRKNM